MDSVLIAKIKSKLEDKIEVSHNYKTLFTGLKVNHPRKVAITHPLLYIARRIALLSTAVYFVEVPMFTLLAFMGFNMVTLAYGLHEKQWSSRAINQ